MRCRPVGERSLRGTGRFLCISRLNRFVLWLYFLIFQPWGASGGEVLPSLSTWLSVLSSSFSLSGVGFNGHFTMPWEVGPIYRSFSELSLVWWFSRIGLAVLKLRIWEEIAVPLPPVSLTFSDGLFDEVSSFTTTFSRLLSINGVSYIESVAGKSFFILVLVRVEACKFRTCGSTSISSFTFTPRKKKLLKLSYSTYLTIFVTFVLKV